MRKIFLLAILSALLFSCNKETLTGSGSITTVQRNPGNFAGISVSGANNVFIQQGDELKVEVKGYSNLITHYETELKGNILELHYPERTNVKNDNVEVFITMPLISGIEISGSSNVTATGEFNNTASLTTKISGSGSISIEKAFATKYTSGISGSGNINTAGVSTDDAVINISGSGNVQLSANKTLHVNISGSGNVYYSGNPQITMDVSGSGKVIKL